MLLHTALAILLVQLTLAQKPSPCPDIFTYEPRGSEQDRWYAKITVSSPDELNGVWLRLKFDEQAELLGNWFGESSSEDNKEFVIKNRNYVLRRNGNPLSVRLFVKYNLARTVPSLTEIRLNGKVICPSGGSSSDSTEPTLHLSQLKPSTQIINRQPIVTTASSLPEQANNEDDIFPGDLSSRRPVVRPIAEASERQRCGTVKLAARPLITYGQSTSEGQWPWHAAIYRYKGINMQYICGASLISPNHVITAAHCVAKSKSNVAINPDILLIYLGKYNLIKQDPYVQSMQVTRITIHPQYNASYFQNDLAILHLESSADITDYVRYVCLWEEDVSLSKVVEKLGTVVGWGFDETGEITPSLMQAKMPVVATETCIFSNRDFFSRFTSEKTYCAGFRNGTSACTGDSGGGMVFPKTGTSGQNTIWQLRGVVSLSAALQNEKVVCDTSNYIVFTDVAKHLDWIRSVVRT